MFATNSHHVRPINQPLPIGRIVTIGRQLYEIEAHRPASPHFPALAGKTVYSLRRIADGTRWRTTCPTLSTTATLSPAQAFSDELVQLRASRRHSRPGATLGSSRGVVGSL